MSSMFNSTIKSTSFRLCAVAAGLLVSGVALADAHLDPLLLSKMSAATPAQPLQVVISYKQSGPVTAAQVAALSALGINRGLTMRKLPIAGALATSAEIRALAKRSDVLSIYFNAPLKYLDQDANGLSGAARAVASQADYGRSIPYSGKGVTVLLDDSGIDGTHLDVSYPNHVVQNTQGATNLYSKSSMLPVTYIEGVPNTDWGSGHGTHCAGIIGGSGARSNGLYKGVAPGASIVGYGSGAVLLILDAVGGLDYALVNQNSFANPIRVTSNSYGSSGAFDATDPINVATYELYKKGIVTVFAAGNSGPGEDTHNPYAQAPWVVSVGASEKNGILTSFSSRGKRGVSDAFSTPDGVAWTHINQPTVVAPGVNIISTRALTGALPPLAAQADEATLAPSFLPFYTVMSGTSMATPHVAGVVALMFEANPNLNPAQVIDILKRTATNMTGRLAFEAGAGHVNAYTAVAEAAGVRMDFGATVNELRRFNSSQTLVKGPADVPFSITFTPVGPVTSKHFTVGPGTAYVSAHAVVDTDTVALVLIDPNGKSYGSSIAEPVIGDSLTTSAPAMPGDWQITVRGIGSISGTSVDPLHQTNGIAAPGTVDGTVSFLDSGGYSGLADLTNAKPQDVSAIQYAVANRLVDGHPGGIFEPAKALTRGELAQYLLMGASVRQYLPFSSKSSFKSTDLASTAPSYTAAESAITKGGPLRDLTQTQNGVMTLQSGGLFNPNAPVTRVDLAYSLVQSLALQTTAQKLVPMLTVACTTPVTTTTTTTTNDAGGQTTTTTTNTPYLCAAGRIPVDDGGSVSDAMRGYVQLALDRGVMSATFTQAKGAMDAHPTAHATFGPSVSVTRAEYATDAGRYLTVYQTGL